MTQIILKDIPDNYFDVFSSDYFNGSQERELNWLEKSDRQKERDSDQEIIFESDKKESNE